MTLSIYRVVPSIDADTEKEILSMYNGPDECSPKYIASVLYVPLESVYDVIESYMTSETN